MDNLKQENQDYSNDIVNHLEKLIADLYRFQISNNKNYVFCKSIEILIEKIEMLIRLVKVNVRFDWLKIQNEMDRLYKIDNSLTGYNIHFDFKESKESKRALIRIIKIDENEKGK